MAATTQGGAIVHTTFGKRRYNRSNNTRKAVFVPKRCVTAAALKVSAVIKVVCEAGKANPSPPVGPALGAKGVNIMAFCKEYNAKTAANQGEIIPAVITVFEDKSFTFVLKTPPTSSLIKKAVGIGKG